MSSKLSTSSVVVDIPHPSYLTRYALFPKKSSIHHEFKGCHGNPFRFTLSPFFIFSCVFNFVNWLFNNVNYISIASLEKATY